VCEGCFVEVVDRTAVEPVRAGVRIVATLRGLFGKAFEVEGVGRLLRNEKALKELEAGEDVERVVKDWQDGLKEYQVLRAKYLLY